MRKSFLKGSIARKLSAGQDFAAFYLRKKELLSKSKVELNEGHDRANIIFNLGVNYLWVIYHQRFPILGEAPQINRGVGYEGEPAEKNFP